VKLFLFRTKLQDCFLFVKKKFCEVVLDKLVTKVLFSVDLERLIVGSSFGFWAIMQIPIEGKISFILPLEEPAPCTPRQYHWGGYLSERSLSSLLFTKKGAEHASVQFGRMMEG
jgi:hypothetical protein